LGFKYPRDGEAWLSIHDPTDQFGFVIDFHMLMEHIFTRMTSEDILKKLEKVYKLELNILNQACTMTSFQERVPNFFDNQKQVNTRPPGNKESCFSCLPLWNYWDAPHDGHCDKLK